MKKRNNKLILLSIFVLVVLAVLFDFPGYYNQGVDNFNKNASWFKLPSFYDKPFQLGLDLQGGTHLLYEADLSGIANENKETSMDGLRDVIERRVDFFGVREPKVQTQEKSGHHRLIVELAGITDPNEAIELIGKTPFLEFRDERPQEEAQAIFDKLQELEGLTKEQVMQAPNWELAFQDPNFKPTNLTGKYLERAELGFDQTVYTPLILLQFNDEGAELFEELTTNNVGKNLAIFIDGAILSAPVVQEPITGGNAQITGDFTVEEARELVRNLNAGALPVPIELISQQSVGPTLGKISLTKSLWAGVFGFLAVIIFMVVFYRLPGLLASLSLAIYIILILSLFKLIPVTLTLAGIGGVILSIGMAIDANILIFSRMKEELKEEKNFATAIEEGFCRAWPSIRDGNLTTLIIALVLFSFGSSFVKGFATTLLIGIIMSLFSAIVITRAFLRGFESTRLENIKWLWK